MRKLPRPAPAWVNSSAHGRQVQSKRRGSGSTTWGGLSCTPPPHLSHSSPGVTFALRVAKPGIATVEACGCATKRRSPATPVIACVPSSLLLLRRVSSAHLRTPSGRDRRGRDGHPDSRNVVEQRDRREVPACPVG